MAVVVLEKIVDAVMASDWKAKLLSFILSTLLLSLLSCERHWSDQNLDEEYYNSLNRIHTGKFPRMAVVLVPMV